MSRLIIVSNRVQQPVAEGAGNQGGLAVALSAALREHSGLWFGWSGDTTAHFTGEIDFQTNYGVTTATIDLEERSEEHTSELQSLMRISYAVFCLKKKKYTN